MDEVKRYENERDIMEMDRAGNYYCRHVSAMTREALHSKSDIAAELGWRDMQIDKLRERVAELDEWQQDAIPVLHSQNAELSALRAQEPVAYGRWAEGLPKGTRLLRYDDRPLVDYKPSESFDVPLYAAPVPAQPAVVPERVARPATRTEEAFGYRNGWNDCLDEFARLNGSKDQ